MALDPNIILQAGNFKAPDYATTLAQVANIKASGQEAKLRDLQITGVQRDNDTRVALSKAFDPTTGQIDPVKANAAFMASGDVAGARKFEADRLAAVNAQLDNAMKVHSTVSQILGGVTDQTSLDAARAELGKNPALAQGVAQLPAQYDEAGAATIQNLMRQGQTVGEQLQAKQAAVTQARADAVSAETARHNKATEGQAAATLAQQATTNSPKNKGEIAGAEEAAKLKAQTDTYGTDPGANPIVQSHVANVLNGNETMANVPAPLKNAVSLAITQQPKAAYAPLAASRNTMAASRIIQNYIKLPQYELTANGLPYLQRIDAAMKTPGSVSDQDLLDSLTKLNTAGNAISDAQVKIITDGKSLSDWAGTVANKFKNGGVLSENQRNQIHEIAKNIYANYKKGYQPVYDQVTKQLKASGIPEPFWSLPDLNNLSAQAGLGADAPPATESKVIGGVTYHKVNGQWMQ